MLDVVQYRQIAEWNDSLEASTTLIATKNSILNMDASDTSGLQHSQQMRSEEVHLLKELIVILVKAEVIVCTGVLVLVTERNRRYNQTNGIIFHIRQLQTVIVIDRPPQLAALFLTLREHITLQSLNHVSTEESVLSEQVCHLAYHFVVSLPLLHEGFVDFLL